MCDVPCQGNCSVSSDCRQPGQKCHNLMDATCLCKGGSHFNHKILSLRDLKISLISFQLQPLDSVTFLIALGESTC